MKRNQLVLWIVGLAALTAAAFFIVRSALWKPERPSAGQPSPPPHFPLPGSQSDLALVQAMELEQAGKADEAMAAYGAYLETQPGSWIARVNRARLYERAGKTAEALADLDYLTREQPRNLTGWVRLALLQDRLGERDGARKSAEKILELRPMHADPYLILSNLDADADLDKSIAELEEYLRRVWLGNHHDADRRQEVENRQDGVYLRRVMERFRRQLPEGADRDARAEMAARWFLAQRYVDHAPFGSKFITLEHLQRYLDLVKVYGDPDAQRYQRAQEMVAKLKQELRDQQPPIGARSVDEIEGGQGRPADGGSR